LFHSKNVFNAFQNTKKLKHQLYVIQEINHLLSYCKERNKIIELIWIPAHKNIHGNNKVDELAEKSASEDLFILILPAFFKAKCKMDNDNF